MFKQFCMLSLFIALVLMGSATTRAQREGFIAVEGTSLRSKIDNAIRQGRAKQSRFWTAYSFEVRPGVAVDLEINNENGSTTIVNGTSVSIGGSQVETRNLGIFALHEPSDGSISRIEIYNLDRQHEYSGYPVYWAGRATNEESLNYLKSIVDSDVNRLSDRAAFAIALHDDARVEAILTDMIRKPVAESIRNRAIYWLGYTAESQAKNAFLAEIVRNQRESTDAREQAMSALGMSKAAATLPLLETMYETMTSRDLKRRALSGIARNDNRDAAATYLIRIAENERDFELRKSAIANLGRVAGEKSLSVLVSTLDSSPEFELQKTAVSAIGRRPKDESIPILIRTARSHPRIEIRKLAVQALGHTGDERAIAFLRELLGN